MKTYSRHGFTREERAARAKVAISAAFESKEQAFLDFVLSHYVRVGVQELDQENLTALLRLKYNNSIADAVVTWASLRTLDESSSASRNIWISKKRVLPEHR
jgi:3-deoxy-D-arabino-heptulosonate 7-phosphate (DAHP) synthase